MVRLSRSRPAARVTAVAEYSEEAYERFVAEPQKRPGRTAFERDRARILHSSALRRLAGKTQVMGAGTDDFVRNRLTHSLEVAQVARELGKSLGCDPEIVDSAALSHDLGHPPFGHNGEVALNEVAKSIGGFEGNAQTLRILSRLEAKTVDAGGASVGLNLTRATLSSCVKYPWGNGERETVKFGVYEDDRKVFDWLDTQGRLTLEAQVMDLSDDIAYSVHDIEDGVVGGWLGLDGELDEVAAWRVTRDWYDPAATDDQLSAALDRLTSLPEWPKAPFTGERESLAVLKSLTSALIGRFAAAAFEETVAKWGSGPLVRYGASLEVPQATWDEINVLKSLAAHHIMRADLRVKDLATQRELLAGLVAHLRLKGEGELEPVFAADFRIADSDSARLRVIVDQVASLTDASAVAWARRLLG